MIATRAPFLTAAVTACALLPLHAIATLVPGPDGATVHDTVNGVTWLANFNLPASNRFGLPVCNGSTDAKSCVNASGSMTYQAAAAWVNAMNAANYLGHGNWQLPTTPITDAGCSFTGPQSNSFGFDCAASALGSLYYGALGLKAPNTAVPIPADVVGPFANLQPYIYWSQSSNAQTGSGFSTFSFDSGYVGSNTAPNYIYVLPMIPGKLPGTPAASGTGLQVNPGGQTVYDPVANVTWLANANVAATSTFGLPRCSSQGSPHICVNADGAMNADSASQFVAGMNGYNGTGYLGQKNWQLPPMAPGCTQYNCSGADNPMGNLYYGQLGFAAGTPVVAAPDIAVGPFNHMQPYLYWACQGATIASACSGTGPATGFEWSFSFGNGFEGTDVLANDLYVTAYFPDAATAALNVQGLWWRSPAGSENGWGVNLAQQGDILFATWFTYDTDGSGLWLVMPDGAKTADATYTGTLYRTIGPAFDAQPWDPTKVVATAVGTATFTFSDANDGTFTYAVNGVTQSKPITRQVFSSPVPTCVAAGTSSSPSNYSDLWWRSPAGSESGWGVNIAQQGDILFATWFTYDTAGKGMWLVMSDGAKTGPGTYSGALYRTTGPAFSANPWDATHVGVSQVGTATFTFSDASDGTFAYTVDGISQSKPITRQVYGAPATVCN